MTLTSGVTSPRALDRYFDVCLGRAALEPDGDPPGIERSAVGLVRTPSGCGADACAWAGALRRARAPGREGASAAMRTAAGLARRKGSRSEPCEPEAEAECDEER